MVPGCMVFANHEGKIPTQPTVISSMPIQVSKNTTKQVFYEDLDGNGKKEKVVLLADYDQDSGAYILTLKINDRKMKLTEEWMGSDVGGYIVDINSKDKIKEFAVGGDLCSSDYATYFYRYEKGQLVPIGHTQGTLKPVQLDRTYQMRIPGDGTLQTYTRGNVLQTWYRDEVYRLDSQGKLIVVPRAYYGMETPVTLLQELPIYEKPDVKTAVVKVLMPKEQATLLLTDDKKWCQIQDESGNIGWFEIKEDMKIQLADVDYWSWEVFEGLFFAD